MTQGGHAGGAACVGLGDMQEGGMAEGRGRRERVVVIAGVGEVEVG